MVLVWFEVALFFSPNFHSIMLQSLFHLVLVLSDLVLLLSSVLVPWHMMC
jgi:hypothetical protein